MLQSSPSNRFGEWNPLAEMQRLQSQMNRLFDDVGTRRTARGFPPVNLWLGDDSIVVTVELPGLSHDDIELTVQENALTIEGERKPALDGETVAWHRRERAIGQFGRTIELPFRVDPERIEARFQNGVLAVEMQRPEEDRPRRIAINAA